MKRLFLVISVTLFTFLFLGTCVYAEVPHMIRFQGKVTDDKGKPLTGEYNVTFRIYNAETGGTLMWSETQSAVPVNNGIFTVLLGDVAALDLPFDEPYWLSMEVNDDGEMSPRQRIGSVGYAIHAEVADSIAGVSVVPQGAIILWRGTSCPEGYSPVNELKGKFLMGKAENESEQQGGSSTHNHGGKAGSHSLSIPEMPEHNHTYGFFPNGSGGGCRPKLPGDAWDSHNYTTFGTSTTGGGQGHTHTILPADSRPEFVTVLFCEKD